ncbi:MAG: glycosyl transferase [Phototrophicales bacterium]|nr:MAG: glycosyl transferase [Phototrophicales bacterium]RMG76516.1 MAG: glycosyltransferase family 2 protein [Chloroflexota bacterium]
MIIPVHNEEHRMPPSLEKIDAFLSKQSFDYEVVIVENGSVDRTFELAQQYSETHPYVRAIQVNTRGKGLAVKAGMLAARGEYRFICDVDLSMPIEEIMKFLPPHAGDADIIIASREGKGANRIGEPEYRHIMGRVLNFIIKLTAVRGFEDTQCGFKMFTRDVAEDLFRVQRMSGIGFDVELLFIAKRRGYVIKEVPITWYFDSDSRMKLIQDSLHILVEIWQIRKNWRKGIYAKKEEKA